MANIHSTAMVSATASLADDVVVGPYVVIEDNVHIGQGTTIGSHSVIHSFVRMGNNNRIHNHVVLGDAPQDISYQGEQTWLEMENDNVIREFCSIHRSTNTERATHIGNACYMMCNSHLGHDCQVGNEVIITAYAGISGHVEIGDNFEFRTDTDTPRYREPAQVQSENKHEHEPQPEHRHADTN